LYWLTGNNSILMTQIKT